jgi:hypothetical protein
MTQQDWATVAPLPDESEVERRYAMILRSLQALLPGHGALLDELDASVSELLAEADDRARVAVPEGTHAVGAPPTDGGFARSDPVSDPLARLGQESGLCRHQRGGRR